METIKVHQAKTQLSSLLARVEQGEEFLIARGDRTIARLSGVAGGSRELGFVSYRVPADFDQLLPESELAAWER